jgi:hypothetical protein
MFNLEIKPEDKVCYNCKFLFWGVGIGMGIRCNNENNRKGQELPPITHSKSTCGLFSKK